jgi:hypothetical protein
MAGGIRAARLAVVILALSGCGGNVAQPESSRPASESATAEPTAAPAAAKPVKPAKASCADRTGDSQGGLDLTGAAVKQDGEDVVFTWRMKGRVPASDTVLWSATLTSADGHVARQIGYKLLDRSPIAYFVYDMSTSKQNNLTGSPKVTATSVSATFPGAAAGLGNGWPWTADLSLAGKDVDSTCE